MDGFCLGTNAGQTDTGAEIGLPTALTIEVVNRVEHDVVNCDVTVLGSRDETGLIVEAVHLAHRRAIEPVGFKVAATDAEHALKPQPVVKAIAQAKIGAEHVA